MGLGLGLGEDESRVRLEEGGGVGGFVAIDFRLRIMVWNESRSFWRVSGGSLGGFWEVFCWEDWDSWFDMNDMLRFGGGFGLLRESRQYSVRKEL